MGLFKQMKDMKNTVHEAPGMIQQAQEMGAQAQQMAVAQQAAAQAAMAQAQAQATVGAGTNGATGAPGGADFDPIAGVSLELYADISKGLAAYNYDQSKAVVVAAEKGVDEGSWQQALDGWNVRMKANPAIAQRFNALYTGRA